MVRDCCVFIFTETWLNNNVPDSTIQLDGFSGCRVDRVTFEARHVVEGIVSTSVVPGAVISWWYPNTVGHR